MEALLEIHSMFSRNFAEGTMEPLQPDLFQGLPCINMANHYFTSCRDDTYSMLLPFNDNIDPNKIPSMLNDWFHALNNKVLHFHYMPESKNIK
jgi:hypothetical protein